MYLSYWNMYMYLGCNSIPDDCGRFRRFRLDANEYVRTHGHTDGRTDPCIEMRGRI